MSIAAVQLERPRYEPDVPVHGVPSTPQRSPRRSIGVRASIALTTLWLLSGWYIVLPDQQAVELVFGKVVSPRSLPGLHFTFPWPVAEVVKLKVRQMRRVVIGADAADSVLGRSQPQLSRFLTGDQNIINLRVVVQYSVGEPVNYLFQSENPEKLVGATVEAEMARSISRRGVDEVLTTEKVAIQEESRAAAQKLLNEYQAGVQLSTVSIESLTAPPEVAAAFRDVASARADTARIISGAQAYANDAIPKARGQARQMIESALGYRKRKIDEASGDAARFMQMLSEYSKASEVTRRRLYLETMEQVLPRIKKLVVDPNRNLDLTIVRKGEPAVGKQP